MLREVAPELGEHDACDRAPAGRTGDDTELGGTGPGGEHARGDGAGKGSEDGGRGGSEGGSRDGQPGGAEGGMYGVEGKLGDDGVPSGSGVLGVVSVPASLKGAVELSLILSEADFAGFGKKAASETLESLIKSGAKDLSKSGADAVEPEIRAALASRARGEAAKATKTATKKVATDKRTAAAWKQASKEEKAAFQRKVYYDHVDRLYREAEAAAKKARTEAEAIFEEDSEGRGCAGAPARSRVDGGCHGGEARRGTTAAEARLRWQGPPRGRAPSGVSQERLSFTKEGYPDFEPHAMQLPNGSKRVQIEYTGSRDADFRAANKAAKFDEIPRGYTWHHLEDGKSMMLVPRDLHKAVKHSGGVSRYKHNTGVGKYD